MRDTILFSGTSNAPLARAVARSLKIPFGRVAIKKFRDGETYVNIEHGTGQHIDVGGKRAIVMQSGAPNGNESFMELLLLLDAVYRLHPKELICVLPFYPYRRQERKVESGEAVSAAVVARCIEAMHVDRVLAVDLHVEKIREFFTIPCTNVKTMSIFVEHFQALFAKRRSQKKKRFVWHGEPWVVVAPDLGSRTAARALAEQLNVAFVQSYKHRHEHDVVEVDSIEGGVAGKHIIILDDEINTAGTMVENARALYTLGARAIYIAATHGIFADHGLEKLHAVPYIRAIVITDTIARNVPRAMTKVHILSAARVLRDALQPLL
ncbi:ribose-phosphate pyrophosphokinase [Candidatus Uhrbacteria bacterium]|nr:ribose-phosphate pyrophosphokinase [Candidatus Uhrbacteria bacterium]